MADANVSVSFSASIADFVSGVAEAKDALQSFSAPFGEINGQLASFANASSQAFSPDRLQSYHDALAATQSLEQSFAADSVRAAAAMRAGDDEAYADATRAAQLATSEELRILADALKQKLALYAEEARFYEITQQQKLALSQAALDEEYAAELAALQKREALGEQSLAVKQRIDDMIIEATRRRDDETTALTRSALQEQERDYQSFANSIMGAFNSQLRGLLSGTENWHAAFKSVLDDLLIKFIEWCETTVEHYVLAEAMKTAATTTGVAARTSAEDAGAAASMGAQGAAMVRSILSSAAETFAGVFGFLSPLMGPFAAGPGRGSPGHGRRHGGLRRLGRHRHVAGAAGHADPGPSQRAHHAAGGSGRLSLASHRVGERRFARRVGRHSSDHELQRLGARRRVGLVLDAQQRPGHGEGARRSGAARRRARAQALARLMTSVNLIGVHLLPSTGEFAYDIYPAVGAQRGPSGLDNLTVQNTFSNPSLAANVTDYTNSIEQLQAQHPECTTVSVVVAWFFNSEDASTCQIYPSTNFILGEFQQNTGSGFLPVHWMVSSLTEQSYPGPDSDPRDSERAWDSLASSMAGRRAIHRSFAAFAI